MKKGSVQKIFVLTILTLIITSFLVSVVIAADATTTVQAPLQRFTESISRLFGSDYNWEVLSARLLLLVLIILIIFGISNNIPFLDSTSGWIRFFIATIIGILSVAYLAPEDIYTALMSYEALGIVLTTAVPLVILLVVTIQWNTKHPDNMWLSMVLWLGFLIAFLIKYLEQLWIWVQYIIGSSAEYPQIGTFGIFFIGLTGLISIIMLFAGGQVSRWWFRFKVAGLIDKSKITSDAERAARIAQLESFKLASPQLADYFDDGIKRLQKLKF